MKILLVDDEHMSRKATAEFLEEQLGHNVIQCGDGYDAKKVLEKEFFPLIISDIRMPKMDGLELLKYAKTNTALCNSDVILITGHGDMDTAIKALRYGAYDFIPKPIDIEQLASTISKSMERQALIIENAELKRMGSNGKVASINKSKNNELYSHVLHEKISLPSGTLDINELQIEIMEAALAMHEGNKTKTAEYLNTSVNNLQKQLKKKEKPSINKVKSQKVSYV